MAETLTYDPGTSEETNTENLSQEEQESLKVGEQLVEQQEQLLAGKYKDAEELEKLMLNFKKSLEKKVLKIARKLGTPNLLTEKQIQKKRKKLKKYLQRLN